MKKTIIAAAVAAAVAAPAAFADVSVSGLVHMAVTNTDTTTSMSNATGAADNSGVSDNVSRLVFKGSEDLGNGMSAGFKMEDRINMNTGDAATDDGRENYVFLKGGFGNVQLGRIYGPAKVAYSMTERAGDTAIDISTLSASEEKTEDNTVQYTSPSFNGLTLKAALSGGNSANTDIGDTTDVSLTYSNGPLTVAVASYSSDADSTEDQDVFAIKYTMGDITVAYSQMDTDETSTTAGDEEKESKAASVAYAMGNNTLIAQYGEVKHADGATGDGWGAALVHSMSKNTSVYLGVRDSDVAGDLSTGYALGIKQTF